MRARLLLLLTLALVVAVGCRGKHDPNAPDEGTLLPYDGPLPELVVQAGHNHLVRDVDFSPDGRLLAGVGADGIAKLWDLRLGRELRTLRGARGPLYQVDFDASGRFVAAGGLDKSVHIWNVETGEALAPLVGHSDWVWDVEFSPDGRHLASGGSYQDRTVAIWNLETRNPDHVLIHDGGIADLAWSPDGKVLVTASGAPAGGNVVTVWDAGSGARLGTVDLDARTTGEARRTTADDGTGLGELGLEARAVGLRSLAFSRDGRWLAVGARAGDANVVVLFDASTWARGASVPGELIDFDPGSGLLLVADAQGASRWDPATGTRRSTLASTRVGALSRASISPDGKLLAGCDDDGMDIELVDAASGQDLRRFRSSFFAAVGHPIGNDTLLLHVDWSPKAPILASGGFDGKLRIFDLRAGAAPKVVEVGEFIRGVRFTPAGTSIVVAGDEALYLHDSHTGTLLQKFPIAVAEQQGVMAFAISKDGTRLAGAHGRGYLTTWDLETGRVVGEAPLPALDADCQKGPMRSMSVGAPVSGLEYSGDGSSLYVTYQETAVFALFDAATLKVKNGGCAHQNRINRSVAAATGDRIAFAGGVHMLSALGGESGWSDNSVHIFSLAGDMKLEHRVEGHELAVLGLDFDSRGTTLATGSVDATIKLWDTATGQERATLRGHDAEVASVAFSHDDRFLVSASYDLSLKIWDASKGELVATLVALGDDDFVIATPDSYYTASRGGLDSVAFRLGQRVLPVELFDLQLNRPDIVLARLGYAPESLRLAYRRAYEKRLEKMGVSEDQLRLDYELPLAKIVQAGLPLATSERQLALHVEASDARHTIDRILLYVNDVPVHGSKGLAVDGSTGKLEQTVDVTLSQGRNKIQVSVRNDAGAESLKDTYEVVYQGEVHPPRLHVVAIGISDYEIANADLRYAAKDAKDLGALLRDHARGFASVDLTSVLDHEAKRERILEVRSQLERTHVDDQVVLFVAGHGMLDTKMDYYFVTSDFELEHPSKRGVSYEELEGLLDGIPARRKLLLMDTCHSGEVDEGAQRDAPPLPGAVDTGKGAGNVTAAKEGARTFSYVAPIADTSASRALISELFADLRRGTGATVISSAGAAEYALESSQWNNGVFTYSILQGLSTGQADADHDGTIRVSELRDYVVDQVKRLTGGRQTPTSRRENLEFDFPVL